MLLKVWVLKVYICHTRWVLFLLRIIDAILVLSCGESFEFHHVLSQCARLVTENIMHHTKLFVQV